jgi:hypothetical protein
MSVSNWLASMLGAAGTTAGDYTKQKNSMDQLELKNKNAQDLLDQRIQAQGENQMLNTFFRGLSGKNGGDFLNRVDGVDLTGTPNEILQSLMGQVGGPVRLNRPPGVMSKPPLTIKKAPLTIKKAPLTIKKAPLTIVPNKQGLRI